MVRSRADPTPDGTGGSGPNLGIATPFVEFAWESVMNGGVPDEKMNSEVPMLLMSYSFAIPMRTEVLPSPRTSQAKPNRGLIAFLLGLMNGISSPAIQPRLLGADGVLGVALPMAICAGSAHVAFGSFTMSWTAEPLPRASVIWFVNSYRKPRFK